MTGVTWRKTEKLIIRCRPEVKKAFKKYAVDYPNYEQALIALMVKAGLMPKTELY